MTPEHAGSATGIPSAKLLAPMNYGHFNNPSFYTQYPELNGTLNSLPQITKSIVRRLKGGETITL